MIQQPIRLALAIGWHYGCNRKTLRGIKRYAVASHHSILIEPLSPQFFKAIRRWQPDAIIADPERPSLVEDLLALDLPTISVLCTWHMPDHPGVGKDDHAVGRAGAAHLLEKGLRRFGYVGYPDICWSQWRAEGFAQAVHDAGGECRQFSCSSSAFPRLASEKADRRGDGLRTWLREEAKPIGILCANDPLGQELAQLCRELDLRVPEDVAIVGVDNDDVFCELADPTLSSVDVPWERMGYEAAAMLDRLLAGEAMPTAPRLLPPAGVRQRES
ncbi:MAG: XylR family transcriptional regulator, partial [Phycisphaeraceae bacterium]